MEQTVPSPAVYKAATSTKDFLGKKPPNTTHFEGKKRLKRFKLTTTGKKTVAHQKIAHRLIDKILPIKRHVGTSLVPNQFTGI